MLLCVLFVTSTSGIVFNTSADAVIDRSRSAKDIDQYFKSQLWMGFEPTTSIDFLSAYASSDAFGTDPRFTVHNLTGKSVLS